MKRKVEKCLQCGFRKRGKLHDIGQHHNKQVPELKTKKKHQ